MSFKYERLSNICHWCGKLTHMDRDCPIWEKGKHALKEAGQQYGSWMKATIPNLSQKSVVSVAELEDYDSESVSSEKSNEVVERDKPVIRGAVVLSSKIDGSIQNGMEVLQGGLEVNENGSKGVQSEQGRTNDGDMSLGHDANLEALQNENALCKERMASRSNF